MDLGAVYARIDSVARCAGCHRCATRCADAIPFVSEEWQAVRAWVCEQVPAERLARVLGEDKCFAWDSEGLAHSRACPLYDRADARCMVYPVRPLVCRLLGVVEWMPCPIGMPLERLAEGPEWMARYAALGPRSVDEWLREAPLRGRED